MENNEKTDHYKTNMFFVLLRSPKSLGIYDMFQLNDELSLFYNSTTYIIYKKLISC